jgi:hypothetical protein
MIPHLVVAMNLAKLFGFIQTCIDLTSDDNTDFPIAIFFLLLLTYIAFTSEESIPCSPTSRFVGRLDPESLRSGSVFLEIVFSDC